MDKTQFRGGFSVERKVLCGAGAVLFVLLVSSGVLLLTGDPSFRRAMLALSGGSSLLIGLVGLFVFLHYWSAPDVRESGREGGG
jgi:hypothetical protein